MNLLTDVIIPILKDTLTQFLPLFPHAVFICMATLIVFLIFNHNYKKGTYYKITHNPYLSVRFDLGKYGEYLIYRQLKHFENNGDKFLFNVYIPKKNGETSEIDVLLICKKGIFVFESKNYSGWIFGSEDQPKWTQTLPRGKGKGKSSKEHFYNPIMQNRSHIKYLKNLIGEDTPTHSVIVFSNRCTLKGITVKSNIPVINRSEIYTTVSHICSNSTKVLNQEKIGKLYDILYPFTQVSDEIKSEHISRIKGGNTNTAPTETKAEDTPTVPIEASEKPNSEEGVSTCPHCGSKLVLRTAKRGNNAGQQFYGCSAYPKCKYIKK